MIQIPTCDSPKSLISLAINMDRRIRERRPEREAGLCHSEKVSTSSVTKTKLSSPEDEGEVLLGRINFSPKNVCCCLPIQWEAVLLPMQAFVDSGAQDDFMDFDLAQILGIKPAPLEEPFKLYLIWQIFCKFPHARS